jgi:hypothetical protein
MGGEPTAERIAQKGQTMATTNPTTNEITLRQLFTAVVEGNITPAMQEKAKAEIVKLDATNAKRAEKAKEKAKEYAPIMDAIYEFLSVNGTKTTAEIAAGVPETEGSVPKASSMCRKLVDAGRATSSDVFVKGKGKQKAYTAVVVAEDADDNAELDTTF